MRKKTRSQNEAARELTGLPHDSLASVRGGIGPNIEPGNETGWIPEPNGNEIGPVIDPGNNLGPGFDPGSP